MLLVGEDQPSPRPSQCLMGRARDEMGGADRAWVETGSNGARNVCHIDEEIRACLIGYLPEFPEIYNPRVRARARNDQFWPLPARNLPHVVVIDPFVFSGELIEEGCEKAARETRWCAMGEMAAMGEVHTKDFVSRAKNGEKNRHVGRRPGMGLDIRVLSTEKLAGTLDGNALDGVHVAAAAIETPARIAFGILVRQKSPLRLQ